MSFIFTPVFTDNATRANENPLSDGGNWTVATFNGLQILSNLICPNNGSGGSGNAYYNGASGVLGNDQYISITVNALSNTTNNIIGYIRTTTTLSGSGYEILLTKAATNNVKLISLSAGLLAQTTTTFVLGDVYTLYAIGTTVAIQRNGVDIISVTNSSFTSGISGLAMNAGSGGITNSISKIVMGNVTLSPTVWSPIDSRVSKPNSATFRTVNGAQIDDVQTSSNPAVPGVDSRKAGAPVASGVYPQNSRTFPPFKS